MSATWSEALAEIVSGATTHGGALLAPLGVRFVVAQERRPPRRRSEHVLGRAGRPRPGGRVGAHHLPERRGAPARRGASPPTKRSAAIVASAELGAIEQLPSLRLPPLAAVEGGWAGEAPAPGPWWCRRSSAPTGSSRAPTGTIVGPARRSDGRRRSMLAGRVELRVRFTEQWVRTVETLVLGLLWLAALWVTRKPVSR